jgi:glucokinase
MIVLAGDIGGTHARLALADVQGGGVRIVRETRYPSRDYEGLAPIVRAFLRETGARPERACFGVACQVERDECRAANLPWTIRVPDLAAAIGIPGTAVINDFAAAGHGLACLGPSDLVVLQKGTADPTGPIALLGPGTGLGEGFLLWDGSRYRVHASEGGHADFAPRTEQQFALAEYLRRTYGHASCERVLSGPGLADAYRYLAAAGPEAEQPAVREAMRSEDPAAVVTRFALANADPLCGRALDLFVEVLGAQAGNVALSVVASGGVYLIGGIAPRVVERLRGDAFLRAFRDKGRKAAFLATVPVRVVLNPDVGLLGAAAAGAQAGL